MPAPASETRSAAPAAPPRDDLIVVAGQGRSGTNWLLDLFDAHAGTRCRSEVDELPGSALSELPSPLFRASAADLTEDAWWSAVNHAMRHEGTRDHAPVAPKSWSPGGVRGLGLGEFTRRRRPRRLLRMAMPMLREAEWPVPAMLAGSIGDARPVLKFVQTPGWIDWLLRTQPAVNIVHIVRDPAAFLDSWQRRYVARNRPPAVLDANRARLHRLAALEPTWAERMGDPEAMGLEESELWYWRYATELSHAASAGRDRYELVSYEAIVADPVAVTRSLYAATGLEWAADIETRVRRLIRSGPPRAPKMTAEREAAVARVTADFDLGLGWGGAGGGHG
ncbi:MAG: sulfotransferase [Phycisphaerales bacterium]